MNEREAVKRWLRGQAAAQELDERLRAAEGPQPEQAIAEALAALDVAEDLAQWPSPRDTLAEREVEKVRRRWAKVQRRYRAQTRSR